MSGNEQSNAFNEVRAILGKLDRSIDEARSRRLEPDHPVRRDPAPSTPTTRESADMDREIGGSGTPSPKTELQRKGASFGRAKPLNRNEDNPRQWKKTGDDDQLIG